MVGVTKMTKANCQPERRMTEINLSHALPVRATQSRFGRIDAAVNAASRSELSQPLTIKP
jgi:hypothetical protein